jgi:hypothetical protein
MLRENCFIAFLCFFSTFFSPLLALHNSSDEIYFTFLLGSLETSTGPGRTAFSGSTEFFFSSFTYKTENFEAEGKRKDESIADWTL